MARNIITVVVISSICGVLLGWGGAHKALTSNGWQPEFETKTYELLAETARGLATNPNARAFIEETTYFFGVMDASASGHHEFIIQNVGTEDLILRLSGMTCGCTDIHISRERVPPGGSAVCRLEFSADRATPGRFSEGGVILTNDPENRTIELNVIGVFTNPVVPVPSAVNFSRVPAGATRTATVRFYGFEDMPLELSAPTWTDREHFDFQWGPGAFTEADLLDEFYLGLSRSVVEGTVTVKPGLPIGPFQEWFQMETNYPSQANVFFRVSGQIVSGNVTIAGQGYNRETGVADLGRTAAGRNLSRVFSIQFSGPAAQSATVRVSEVQPSWLQTNLSSPTDAGTRRIFSLSVIVPENAPTGSYIFASDGQQAHITLETSDEAMPTLRIPLQFVVGM